MNMLAIKEARPPYVQFERQAIEDREKTNEAGHFVPKEIDYAIITPQGSKDRIHRIVKEWFDHLRKESEDGRFPQVWLDFYKTSYEAWQKGQEIPLSGTSVRNWPFPSPAQVAMLVDLHLLTVEDVAQANEESIRRMGMGGNSLKQAAVAFLENSSGSGKIIKDMDVLREENNGLKLRNNALERQVQELAAQVKAVVSAQTGNMKEL